MISTSQCWLKDSCNQVDCDKECCVKLLKLDYLYNEANMPLNQRENIKLKIFSVNKCDANAFVYFNNFCENILDNIENGKNIYIYSENVGNGKTVWATKIIQAYINKIWPKSKLECRALFIHVPQFLLALKDNISEKSEYVRHIKENIINCDLVVFDELGTKVATQFELEHLLSYINMRLTLGKSCVYTSNIPPNKLSELLGDRLTSRITNLSECIELKGPDLRKLTLEKGE